MKKKRKNPPTRIYKESKRRPRISRKETANALLGLGLGDDIQTTMLERDWIVCKLKISTNLSKI